jgi:hypothetical protein
MVYGCLSGIIKRINITAARFFGTGAAAGIIPGFHGNTHHLVSFMMQHKSYHGTVNTAAHSYQDLSFTTHITKLNISLPKR